FVATAAGLAVLVVAGGAWTGYHQLAKRCPATMELRVAAAAEVAPAVRAAADAWVKRDDAKVNGDCVAVAVTATDPAAMAAAVSRQHGVNLVGVGAGNGALDPAGIDVWLPDSST